MPYLPGDLNMFISRRCCYMLLLLLNIVYKYMKNVLKKSFFLKNILGFVSKSSNA